VSFFELDFQRPGSSGFAALLNPSKPPASRLPE
jgi:hypothetical protein